MFDYESQWGREGQLTVGRTTLSLAIVTVVVTDDKGFGINLVGNRAAEAVTGETHDGDIPR